MSKIIGILGGMGPMATADLFEKIVKNTPAKTDQEHLRVIIDNNPNIPSRIQAILAGREDPLPELKKSAKLLENAGADFIIMPCCTAHFWLGELQQTVKVPIYSMIENTASYIKEQYRNSVNPILLLASTATIQTNLYQITFQAHGLKLIVPGLGEQEVVAAAISEVKAGHLESNVYLEQLNIILNRYRSDGISAVIGGCTEIPLLFPYLEESIEKFDPTLMLAKMAIGHAK